MSEVVKPSGEPLAKSKKATSNFRGGKPSGEPLAEDI